MADTNRIKVVNGDGFIDFLLDGRRVGCVQRGDASGANCPGRRRVTWHGELELKGFKRAFRPSGAKGDVTRAIKSRIQEWLSNNDS